MQQARNAYPQNYYYYFEYKSSYTYIIYMHTQIHSRSSLVFAQQSQTRNLLIELLIPITHNNLPSAYRQYYNIVIRCVLCYTLQLSLQLRHVISFILLTYVTLLKLRILWIFCEFISSVHFSVLIRESTFYI